MGSEHPDSTPTPKSTPSGSPSDAPQPMWHAGVWLGGAWVLAGLYAVRVWTLDAWWHLATGRWIVSHGRVPETDPFSFTAHGAPWRDVNWLADLILYGAWSWGGAAGLVGLKVVMAGTALTALGAALQRLGVTLAPTLGVLVTMALLVQPRYSMARPSTLGGVLIAVSLLLAIWVMTAAERSEPDAHGGAPPEAGLAMWGSLLFVPLVWVWQQMHLSVVVGMAQLGALTVALGWMGARKAALVAAGSAAACGGLFVVTEKGRGLVTLLLSYNAHPTIAENTVEWLPLSPDMPVVWVPWTLFAVTVVGGGLLEARRRPFIWLLAVLGTVMGVRFIRHLYPGIILTAPMLGLLLERARLALHARAFELLATLVGPLLGLLIPALNLALVPLPVLHVNFGFEADLRALPHDTLPLLKRLPPGRTLNNLGIGGYLIWEEIPGGVFFDGRTAQVYSEEQFIDTYLPITQSHTGLEAIADRYHAIYGLAKVKSRPGDLMMRSPRWLPVLHGQSTTLFVRQDAAEAVTAAGFPVYRELRWSAREAWTVQHLETVFADPTRLARFGSELRRAVRQNPNAMVVRQTVRVLQRAEPRWLAATVNGLEPSDAPE